MCCFGCFVAAAVAVDVGYRGSIKLNKGKNTF